MKLNMTNVVSVKEKVSVMETVIVKVIMKIVKEPAEVKLVSMNVEDVEVLVSEET